MKFAILFFLLMPFAVNANTYCVEDNTLKCRELGYTESSCSYGGVACQYDPSLWYCAKWTCADGRLYTAQNKPAGADCVETAYKDLTCYECNGNASVIPWDVSKTFIAKYNGGGTTKLIGSEDMLALVSRMWIDGTEITPTESTTLASGTHSVAIELPDFDDLPQMLFDGCNAMTELTIPKSITSIELNAFSGLSNLTTIYYLGTAALEMCSFDRGQKPTIYVPADYEGDNFCRKAIIKQ